MGIPARQTIVGAGGLMLARFLPLSLRLWHRWLNPTKHRRIIAYFNHRAKFAAHYHTGFVTGLIVILLITLFAPGVIVLNLVLLVIAAWTAILIPIWSAVAYGFRVNRYVGRLCVDDLIDTLPDARLTVIDAAATASLRTNDLRLLIGIVFHLFMAFVVAAIALETAYFTNQPIVFWNFEPIFYKGLLRYPVGHLIVLIIILLAAWDFRQSIVMACLIGTQMGHNNRLRVFGTLLIAQILFYPLIYFGMRIVDKLTPDQFFGFRELYAAMSLGSLVIVIQELIIYGLYHGFLLNDRR